MNELLKKKPNVLEPLISYSKILILKELLFGSHLSQAYASYTPASNLSISPTKELPLSRMAAEYHPKQDEMRNHSVEEVLSAIGYRPAQVLLGLLQVAERVMPPQKEITLDLGLGEKVLG